MSRSLFVLTIFNLSISLFSCNNKKELPIFEQTIVERMETDGNVSLDINGKAILDTIFFKTPNFNLPNQDSIIISEKNFKNRVSVVDFFFTSCPTICPKMKANLLKINEHFNDNDDVQIISFTIDPKRDSIKKLHSFREKLNLNNGNWHFITGEKDSLLKVSRAFMAPVLEDPRLPGGFDHSGKFVLVDQNLKFRGFYSGTTDTGTARLIEDIDFLLKNEK